MACNLDSLIKATQCNDEVQVRSCLAQGYPLGQSVAYSSNTPLHHAAAAENPIFIDWFVAAGEDPDSRNSMGRTAMHTAAVQGAIKNCLALARNGADLQPKDKYGHTPKEAAVAQQEMRCIAVLDSLVASELIESMMNGHFPKPVKRH